MVTNIVSFVVVICALILIHEWGHFIVARLSGVGVERFSMGFGPVLWRHKGKDTEYCLSAIPMGGYVKMMGDDENPLEGGRTAVMDPDKAFNLKPVWVRFLIVFAGPGMNFVLAFLILASLPMLYGRGSRADRRPRPGFGPATASRASTAKPSSSGPRSPSVRRRAAAPRWRSRCSAERRRSRSP